MAANWPRGIGVDRFPAFEDNVVVGELVVELDRDVDVLESDVEDSLWFCDCGDLVARPITKPAVVPISRMPMSTVMSAAPLRDHGDVAPESMSAI